MCEFLGPTVKNMLPPRIELATPLRSIGYRYLRLRYAGGLNGFDWPQSLCLVLEGFPIDASQSRGSTVDVDNSADYESCDVGF